jgi:hypothetical protein
MTPEERAQDIARELRKYATFTEAEAALLRAARTLRERRGAYRDLYNLDELDLLRRARHVALRSGQRRLWALFLVQRRYATHLIPTGRKKMHACPTCGRRHVIRTFDVSQANRAIEYAVLEKAVRLARLRKAQR